MPGDADSQDSPKETYRLNRRYAYVRSLQMEGSGLSDVGVSMPTVFRVGRLFGHVLRSDWPYEPDKWPPVEPPGLDAKAKKNRFPFYCRARNELEIKRFLVAENPVSVSLPITEQWYRTDNGIIHFPHGQFCPERHAVLIVGYDDETQYFKFMNSWGMNWGDRGCGRLPYGYIEQYCTDAMTSILAPFRWRGFCDCSVGDGKWAVELGLMPTSARSDIHVVSVSDTTTDDDIGWAFAFVERDALDVEEFFVVPAHRRRGVGRVLQGHLKALSRKIAKPIRYWLPHIDQVMQGRSILDIAYSFGMRVHESDVRWAAKKMLERP